MNPHPEGLRERARFMRRNGDSLRVIEAQLGVHYSTVGDWTRGMLDEPTYFRECAAPGCFVTFTCNRSHKRYCSRACNERTHYREGRRRQTYRPSTAPRRRMTDKERALAIAMRRADFTLEEIAQTFGRATDTIGHLMRREGVKRG